MEKSDEINIIDNNIIDLIFLNPVRSSYIPANKIKIRKNAKKYPPFTIKKIDKGRIIIDVKTLFCKFVIFFQNFF